MSHRDGWPEFYILIDRVPIAATMEMWAPWFKDISNRRVAETAIYDKCRVSTVFLGLDHRHFGKGDPVLFETMVFGGPLDGTTLRYSTWQEAERGHNEAVTEARKAIDQVDAIARGAGVKPTDR